MGSIYIVVIRSFAQRPLATDYLKFYESIQLWLSGQNIYTPVSVSGFSHLVDGSALPLDVLHANLNPPFFSLLLAPLSFFEFGVSFQIWSLLGVVAGIVAAWHIPQSLGHTSLSTRLLAVALLLAYYPTVTTVILGQTTLPLLGLTYLLWKFARTDRELSAGIVLGLAISIKLYMGIFALLFLFQHRWRILLWSAVIFMAAQGVSLAVFGVETFQLYLDQFGNISWYGANWNASFLGVTTRLFGDATGSLLMDRPGLASPIYFILSGLSIGLWGWLTVRAKGVKSERSTLGFDLSFSLAVVLMCLVAPLGWIYYFVLLLIPLCVIWQACEVLGKTHLRPALMIAWILSSVPSLLLQPDEMKRIHILFPSGLYFFALIIFAMLLAVLLHKIGDKAMPPQPLPRIDGRALP